MANCTKISKLRDQTTAEEAELQVMTITELYRVIFDGPVTVPEALSASIGNVSLPVYNQSYDAPYADCVVIGRSAKPDDQTGEVYTVTIKYRTLDLKPGEFGGSGGPLQIPTEYTFSAEEEVADVFFDITGDPIVTSAGETFEQFLKKRTAKPMIALTRSETSFDPVAAAAYSYTRNAESVQIDGKTYTQGMLLMRPIRSVKTTQGTLIYYRTTFEMLVDVSGHKHSVRIPDMGTMEFDVVDGFLPILDATGRKVTRPYPLDGHGAAKTNATDTPEIREFWIEPYLTWLPLHLERPK